MPYILFLEMKIIALKNGCYVFFTMTRRIRFFSRMSLGEYYLFFFCGCNFLVWLLLLLMLLL